MNRKSAKWMTGIMLLILSLLICTSCKSKISNYSEIVTTGSAVETDTVVDISVMTVESNEILQEETTTAVSEVISEFDLDSEIQYIREVYAYTNGNISRFKKVTKGNVEYYYNEYDILVKKVFCSKEGYPITMGIYYPNPSVSEKQGGALRFLLLHMMSQDANIVFIGKITKSFDISIRNT